MVNTAKVKQYQYGARNLNFYCLVDERGLPLFAPSIFLMNCAVRGESIKSNKAYAHDLKSFFSILAQTSGTDKSTSLNFGDVTDSQMDAYLNGYLLGHRNLQISTIERHITTLRSFYTFAYEHELIDPLPQFSFTLDTDNEKYSVLETVTRTLHQIYIKEEDFKKIILANITSSDPFIRERNELALKLGYYAGFRTEELVINDNLAIKKLQDLLPKDSNKLPKAIELKVKGKNNKTRTILLNVKVTHSLHKFLWGRGRKLETSLISSKCGKPLKYEGFGTELFRECINNYLVRNALPTESVNIWNARTFHLLRKCFATNAVSFCYDNGLDPRVFVPQWLGHSDPETTNDYILYDALLYQRLGILDELNMKETKLAISYKAKFGKRS